jgi:4a-hydroxytetrahydrobiopterin dehydratase
MGPEEVHARLPEVDGWDSPAAHHLHREFRFGDFAQALAFVNSVGAMAEEQNHHPDLELGWGRVAVRIWTHKIDGLTESDFVFAAKVNRLSMEAEGIRP